MYEGTFDTNKHVNIFDTIHLAIEIYVKIKHYMYIVSKVRR